MSTSERLDASVVIPSYRDGETLQVCLEAVLAQEFDGTYEVVVCVSADDDASLPDLPVDPKLRVLTHVPRLLALDARHRAIEACRGDALAFTDADAVPSPRWLHELVAASDGGRRMVGGSVVNGTPRSWAGTAEYVAEFSDLCPARPPKGAWHGALCNLLIPRGLWTEFGPFRPLVGGHDTAITTRAREQGVFVFAPHAEVAHLNRTDRRVVIRHQRQLGRYAAHVARSGVPYRGGFLVRSTALAPIAAVARFVAAEVRALRWLRGQRVRCVVLAPFLMVLFVAWGAGLATEGWRIGRERRSDDLRG